jgi:hypothetical protein
VSNCLAIAAFYDVLILVKRGSLTACMHTVFKGSNSGVALKINQDQWLILEPEIIIK